MTSSRGDEGTTPLTCLAQAEGLLRLYGSSTKPGEVESLGAWAMAEIDRWQRWIRAAHGVGPLASVLMPMVLGLGRLDLKLRAGDADDAGLPSEPVEAVSDERADAFADRMTLSHLWVLGAYEVIRTLAGWAAKAPDLFEDGIALQLRSVRNEVERVRVPLAKFEPSRRHKDTDGSFVYPGLSTEGVMGWLVAPDVVISRNALADRVLDVLLALYACDMSARIEARRVRFGDVVEEEGR